MLQPASYLNSLDGWLHLLSTIFSDFVKNLNEIHTSSSRDCSGWAVIEVFGHVMMSFREITGTDTQQHMTNTVNTDILWNSTKVCIFFIKAWTEIETGDTVSAYPKFYMQNIHYIYYNFLIHPLKTPVSCTVFSSQRTVQKPSSHCEPIGYHQELLTTAVLEQTHFSLSSLLDLCLTRKIVELLCK